MKIHLFLFINILILKLNYLYAFDKISTCSIMIPVLKAQNEKWKKNKNIYKWSNDYLNKIYCNDNFEGPDFKIVEGTSNEPISFNNSNLELVKKAGNVFYHLLIAKNYWANEIGSEYVNGLPQLTIRLDITNAFSSSRHFKHKDMQQMYNNALTIPEGSTPDFVKPKISWGKEIWFSPSKPEPIKNNDKENPLYQILNGLKKPINEIHLDSFIYTALQQLNGGSFILKDYTGILISYLSIIGIKNITKKFNRFFVKKNLFIETSLVPDVIYHEFSHIALSDTMKTNQSHPVIEGLADYFAFKIGKKPILYNSIKNISNNMPKNGKNKSSYLPIFELDQFANNDFVYSFLWGLDRAFTVNRKNINYSNDQYNFQNLLFQTHFKLDENAKILQDLLFRLVETCKSHCLNPRNDIQIIQNMMNMKGF